jgi:predicted phage tail protein
VRSYATNASGTGQSDPIFFTTLTTIPSITSYNNAIVIGSNATLRAEITSDGGAKITAAGFIISTTKSQAANSTNQFPVQTPSVGDISFTRTGLARGTYWYRAYAVNAANQKAEGTEYSFVIQ